jgi:hypothetical protein
MATGYSDPLPDYFSGEALERALVATGEPQAYMVVLRQDARPAFFHRDGSLLQVKADAITVRFLLNDTDQLAHWRITNDSVVTTLLNDSMGWRLFSHERWGVDELAPTRFLRQVPTLAGVNYYPASSPWSRFWPEFDSDTIAADFAHIRALGGNAVRFFLQADPFLHPETSANTLTDLRQLLSIADAEGLFVVPTLFDLKPGYAPTSWASDARFLALVLPVLSEHENVAYIDIKNEPDLDFAREGSGLVEAWLRTMLVLVRQGAPSVPLTIGWSSPEAAELLVGDVDVVTYHDYGNVERAASRLEELRQLAGGRPVHVTEFGETSWEFLPLLGPSSAAAQAYRLAERIDALESADGLFVWTLHDFPEPDGAAVGHSPWVRGLQSQFGLIDARGAEKPAAREVRSAFTSFLQQEPD